MNEEELIKDIKETKYNEENVEKLLYELKNDTGNYSCYDNAIAIIYYKDLYQKEKEKNKKYEKYIKDRAKIGKVIQTFINKDYVEQEYISKDKIREKIKELEKEEKEYKGSQEWEIQDDILAQIMILQELLEEK